MSSGKKTLLVIATILVIGGGAISFGAFAAAGFNFENLSTESRNWTSSTKTFAPEAENPHTAIVLRDMGEDVRIEPTDCVVISKDSRYVKYVNFGSKHYFEKLNKKIMGR